MVQNLSKMNPNKTPVCTMLLAPGHFEIEHSDSHLPMKEEGGHQGTQGAPLIIFLLQFLLGRRLLKLHTREDIQ